MEQKIEQKIINANASLNLQDIYGNTALIYASSYGYTKIVSQLIKAKANLDIVLFISFPVKRPYILYCIQKVSKLISIELENCCVFMS